MPTKGDVNNDDIIGTLDVSLILDYLDVSGNILEGNGATINSSFWRADTNSDDSISLIDRERILKYLVGLRNQVEPEPQPDPEPEPAPEPEGEKCPICGNEAEIGASICVVCSYSF